MKYPMHRLLCTNICRDRSRYLNFHSYERMFDVYICMFTCSLYAALQIMECIAPIPNIPIFFAPTLQISLPFQIRRVSRSFSRGFGGMSSRTFVSISRVVVCLVTMLTVTLVLLNTTSVKGGGRGSFNAGWGLVGMSCFGSLSCPLIRSVLWTLTMSAIGSCLLLRLLRSGLGLLSVLVTGLSCPMLVISLPPVCGAAGKLGFGITSAGPAPVVLPLLLVVLVVLCWLALVGLVRTPIFLRKKLTESEVGYLHAN